MWINLFRTTGDGKLFIRQGNRLLFQWQWNAELLRKKGVCLSKLISTLGCPLLGERHRSPTASQSTPCVTNRNILTVSSEKTQNWRGRRWNFLPMPCWPFFEVVIIEKKRVYFPYYRAPSPLSSTWQALSQAYSSLFFTFARQGRSFSLPFSLKQIQPRFLYHRYRNTGTTGHLSSTPPYEYSRSQRTMFSFLAFNTEIQTLVQAATSFLQQFKPYVFYRRVGNMDRG